MPKMLLMQLKREPLKPPVKPVYPNSCACDNG